ncbi:tyrosine-type recombinase/integrase [Wenxinia saemankumensis]|uniref:Phage integrase family protein n=1 Tax=Wenxinia saemankumensis TaxID=1447782 RepID=A0A1M6EYH1_9RHOB|nr:tyrosine-type recombinase/integrase [Wenxinia saemankumensis]SHI90460.1 Phage integrase family protein [Wenxinia saemankumensis]
MVKQPGKPHLQRKVVKGRVYWYFRRGKEYIRLPDDPDSAEFDAAYWKIRSGRAHRATKTTYEALIQSYYASPAYLSKKPGTRREYRRTLELIREKNGPKDFTALRRKHVIAARDTYAETWRKANAMVEMLSILAKHAIDLEWITANPASGVEKLKGGEYEPWPDAKLKAFDAYCIAQQLTVERTAYMLCTGTGQRIGDVMGMAWDDFDGEYMRVRQDKTDERLWVACPRFLVDYLDALPRTGRHILAKNLTQPLDKRRVQERVMAVRQKIGAEAYVIHGWRYNAAVALAEAGCSDSEIASVTGHRTMGMVAKYRARASQRRLSRTAQNRREQNGGGT